MDVHPGSDSDVLVVMKDAFNYGAVLDRPLGLAADLPPEYDVAISLAFVTRDSFKLRRSPFYSNVLRETVPV